MQREHKNIMDTITTNLVHTYHMPNTSTIIKQFSQQLATCLHEQYTVPISYLDVRRARKEWKLMKSIQFRLKKENYILRVTDKSSIFHLGHAIDYERKAQAYQEKTGAYIELENDPLWAVFDKVVHLLNDLRSKKRILVSQYNRMIPKRDKVALAYLYFIPKPHKVILFVFHMNLDFSFSFLY
jgi:ribulose bisphosphate carboxylase small subunit